MLKIAYSPIYKLGLPEGHRFPMVKYELIPEQLLYEGTVTTEHFFAPEKMNDTVVLTTHDPDYLHRFKNLQLSPKEMRKIGFPMSQQLVDRCLTIGQGTIDCALYARQYGVAMNIAGGTHHAFSNRGEGFCMLNDIAIAANYLMENKICSRILIIDLDVHQGNGTAEIFQHHRYKWRDRAPELGHTEGYGVFTFSMHGAHNYPLHKETSDLDIALPDKTSDTPYLSLLYDHLNRLMDRVRPEMAFFNSGVDVLETDKLGRLSLSMQGCLERDRLVFETCKARRVPIAVSMGGGYSPRVATIVEAHANTYRVAQSVFF